MKNVDVGLGVVWIRCSIHESCAVNVSDQTESDVSRNAHSLTKLGPIHPFWAGQIRRDACDLSHISEVAHGRATVWT